MIEPITPLPGDRSRDALAETEAGNIRFGVPAGVVEKAALLKGVQKMREARVAVELGSSAVAGDILVDVIEGQNGKQVEHVPKSQRPTEPFKVLTREIGPVHDPKTEVVELHKERQDKVYRWTKNAVTMPYDLIQRAEGTATTVKDTYYGALNRYINATEISNPDEQITDVEARRRNSLRNGTAKASAVSAVRNRFNTTQLHKSIAQDRILRFRAAKAKIGQNQSLLGEDVISVSECLQELGNGVAANMDEAFPGGSTQARVAGNSIVFLAEKLGNADPGEARTLLTGYGTLLDSAMRYVVFQHETWGKKIQEINSFADQQGFSLVSSSS